MVEEEASVGQIIAICLICLVFGAGIGAGISETVINKNIIVSQETADKICLELTNENGVFARDYNDFYGDEIKKIEKGELYCQIPSYDETHLIKVGQ